MKWFDTVCCSAWRWYAAGAMTKATATVTSPRAARWMRCQTDSVAAVGWGDTSPVEEVDFAAVYNAARGLSCRRRSLSLAIRFVTTASIRAR